MAAKRVFIRDATGVVREVNALHASVISFRGHKSGRQLGVINTYGRYGSARANVGLAFVLTIPFVIITSSCTL